VPFHVGLNLVYLVPGETGGMETYARELVRALVEHRPDIRLTAFVNRETAEGGDDVFGSIVPAVTVPVRARNRLEWVRGEQQALPPLAHRAGVDLVHSLASTAPAWGRFKRVVTIHDLHYRVVPDAHFGLLGLGMRVLVPLAARRSDRVIVDAASTRADVLRFLPVGEERVDVVPLGVSAGEQAEPVAEAELRAKLRADDRPILLTVSAKRPHKNLLRLLDAVARIPVERRPVLVLPGYPTPHEAELREHAVTTGVAGDVRFLDWVSAAELEALYAAAAAFVFPSLHEGFGLPVLEAMRRGTPVACSNTSSLPEVAGDAALLFDPTDPAAITASIERLLGDAAEADRLRAAGRARAARFTWERTARATAEAYERTLSDTAR
jgi:glycosyltransferase involved in cell wall biosynthesis